MNAAVEREGMDPVAAVKRLMAGQFTAKVTDAHRVKGRLAYLVKPEVVNCTGSRSTDAAVGRSARRAASV